MAKSRKISDLGVTAAIAGGLLWLTIVGCGGGADNTPPPLAKVTGMVTWNGQPLSAAQISFTPKVVADASNARTSVGVTSDAGVFELSYSPKTPGAIVGEHLVQISKLTGSPEEPGGELLPPQYNVQSQLTATVTESGENEFFFDLKK